MRVSTKLIICNVISGTNCTVLILFEFQAVQLQYNIVCPVVTVWYYQYSKIVILLCYSLNWGGGGGGYFGSSNIEINYFNVISFIRLMPITTYSHLDIISCGGWQLLQEPWGVVEHTASAVCPATSSIP